MQDQRFTPPTADVQDMAAPSEPPARRPISVWLVEALLVVYVVLFGYGMSQAVRGLLAHPDESLSGIPLAFAMGWRVALMLGVIAATRWVHRGLRFARWLGLAAILLFGVAVFIQPDNTRYANEAERDGGLVFRYGILPALLLWWAFAAAFSRKAKRYFTRTW